MAKLKKALSFCLVLLIITASTMLLIAKPANAQTIPQPSAPYFTLTFVDKSYDVPSTTSSTIDPYTNKTTTQTIPGYHVNVPEIEVKITNQQYPSMINGNKTALYYDIQTKGHYSNWTTQQSYRTTPDGLTLQSEEKYTIIYLPAISYQPESKVDVRIQTVLGYQYSYDDYNYGGVPHLIPVPKTLFISKSSGWSSTQTITIPSPTPSVTESPPNFGPTSSASPDTKELALTLVSAALGLSVLCITILLLYVRHLRKNVKTHSIEEKKSA